MEMTLEQQRALAMASAKLRLQEQEAAGSTAVPEKKSPVAAQTETALGLDTASTVSPEFSTTATDTLTQPSTPTPAKKENVPFESLYKDPENFKTIKDYATARFGKAGAQKPNESNEDFAKRFMTSMRQVEWNTSLNALPELNWIYNAKKEDAVKAAKAFELYESTADWYEKGGQPGIRPFAEAAMSAASEPTNIFSFGIGAAARQQAARTGIKAALSDKIKTTAKGAAVEGVLAVGETAVSLQRDLKNQQVLDTEKIDTQSKVAKDMLSRNEITQEQFNTFQQKQQASLKEINSRQISKSEAAIGGLIGSVFGAVEARSAFRTQKLSTKQELDSILEGKKTPALAATDPARKALIDAFDANMDETNRQFDIFEGRKILDDLNPPTGITQAEVKNDINSRAINVARVILLEDPNFSATARRVGLGQQKVSSAVSEVFGSLDKIDDVALERALQKEGLTLQEFSKVTGTTVADAASIMQGYSALARVLKRQAQIDPEAQKLIDNMYLREWNVPDVLITLKDGVTRVERESKAWVVGSFATTARNVIGTSVGLTFDAASNFVESSLYQTGKVLKSAKDGTYKPGDISAGLNAVVKDTFNTLTYLTNGGMTAEVVDRLLIDNPKIKDTLFSALQETGNQNLTKLSKMVNTFNVAQDAIFRRAIFTASVESQMRRVGMDMYQVMADNKAIPTDVIKNAADEALRGTFSYMPKQGVAHHFVKFFEQLPGGSLLVTFPRFMTNAMAFQYKYSPVGAVFGGVDIARAGMNLKSNPEVAGRLYQEGLDKFSKGMVGTAALAAAIEYRSQNQDSPWYTFTNDDGSTVDTRALFPIAPYLVVADYIAKYNKGQTGDAKEVIQTIAGMKLPGGAQGYIIDQLSKAFQNAEGKEAEKLEKGLGTVFGDFAGRFLQPGQPIFAFFELFNTESQKARDPNVIMSDDLVSEAALNRLRAKVPGLKEDLPEAQRYLREETPVRTGEFFNTLMGVRVVPRANDLEREFVRLNMNPYTYFGATGDKMLDRAVIKESGPMINTKVVPLLNSERYNKMSDTEKVLALSTTTKEAVNAGRIIASEKMKATDRERMAKLVFNKLPIEKRKVINEMYKKETGKTLDEAKDYEAVYKYEPRLEAIR
jgi:hypothetical protein